MRQALAEMEASILEEKTTGHFYKVPSKIGKEARLICRVMGIQRLDSPSRYTLKM